MVLALPTAETNKARVISTLALLIMSLLKSKPTMWPSLLMRVTDRLALGEAAYKVNGNTAENLTAAQSRKEDADFADAVTRMKNSQVVNQAQNMTLKKQMDSEESLVNKMFEV